MAVDDSLCPSHEKNTVALYCKTCEVLICTKCVSHSSFNAGVHREHVYLDIGEAYDMWQEELEKLISGIKHDLQEKKDEKQVLQSSLQKLQLSLLRKRTELEKHTKSLKEHLYCKDKQYISGVEQMITPAINRVEENHKSIEYDVVSTEGLLRTAECVQNMSKTRAVTFLKSISAVKREYMTIHNHPKMKHEDTSCTIQTLIDVNLNLHREKYLIDRALTLADCAPSLPRPIISWCVVGQNSASLVWKYNKCDTIKKFKVYYKKFSTSDLKFITNAEVNLIDKGIDALITRDNKTRNTEKSKYLKLSVTIDKPKPENLQNDEDKNNATDISISKVKQNEKPIATKIEKCNTENVYQHENNMNNPPHKQHEDESFKGNWHSIRSIWPFSLWKLQKDKTENKVAKSESLEEKNTIESDQGNVVSNADTSSATFNSKSGTDNTNSSDNVNAERKQPRIRKLSYTISTTEDTPYRTFIDPTEFLNETLKYKNQVKTPATVWPSSLTFRNNASLCNNKQSSLNIHSNKNSCPNASRSGKISKVQNENKSSRTLPPRAHSLETQVRRNSTSITQHRSSTPSRYGISQNTQYRKESVRLSRRDQVKDPKNNILKLQNTDLNIEDDENIKDIYNEKSQLQGQKGIGKASLDLSSNIQGSFALYSSPNLDVTKSCDKTTTNQCCVGQDMLAINKGESHKNKTLHNNEKNSDLKSNNETNYPSKTSTVICSGLKSSLSEFHKHDKHSRSTSQMSNSINKREEFVDLSTIDKCTKQTFKHFKVSKFVIGRVQATIRDLEEDCHYIGLVSASNQFGDSDAAVFNFKTGSSDQCGKPSKCGYMISSARGHIQSYKSIMSNVVSYLICLMCLTLFLFLLFYLFSQNIQDLLCKEISKENAFSSLCPKVVLQDICRGYESSENYNIAPSNLIGQNNIINRVTHFFQHLF